MTTPKRRESDSTPWWKRNIHLLVTWFLILFAAAGQYAIQGFQVGALMDWRLLHTNEYFQIEKRVTIQEGRVMRLEELAGSVSTDNRSMRDILASLDKTVGVLASRVEELAKKIDKLDRR